MRAKVRMFIVSNIKIGLCIRRPLLVTLPVARGFSIYTFYLALPNLLNISCFRMSEISINLNFLATAAICIVLRIPHNTFNIWLTSLYILYVDHTFVNNYYFFLLHCRLNYIKMSFLDRDTHSQSKKSVYSLYTFLKQLSQKSNLTTDFFKIRKFLPSLWCI